MIQGSCLCGGIKYEIDEDNILQMLKCHCSNCRKATGAENYVVLQLKYEHFKWLTGEELITTYDSSEGNHRAFCKICGSCVPQFNDMAPFVGVPAGTLDGDPGVTPRAEIFTGSKLPWVSIDGSIESFPDLGPPRFWAPVMQKIFGNG